MESPSTLLIFCALLDAFVEHGPRNLELHVLSEHVRSALALHICHQYADAHRVICAGVLSPPLEDATRQSLRSGTNREFASTVAFFAVGGSRCLPNDYGCTRI